MGGISILSLYHTEREALCDEHTIPYEKRGIIYILQKTTMDTPMVYEIVWSSRYWTEVVDSFDNMQEAEKMCREYNLAFGEGHCFIR